MIQHISAKGIELHPAQQFVIVQGLKQIDRFCKNFGDDLVKMEVMISFHKPPSKNYAAHLYLEVPGKKMSAVVHDIKFNKAFKGALDKLKIQLRKHRARLRNERNFSKVAEDKRS